MAQPDVYPLHSPGHAYDYDPATYAILEDALNQPFHSEAAHISPTPSMSVPTNQPAPFAQYTSLVGRTITSPSGGRFRLAFRRVLGVGAYGVVYLAEEIEREEGRYALYDPSTPSNRHEREATISTAGRMYAVKVMRCTARGSRQRAFQAREVALHRKADGHPGIVPLHAVYGTGRPPTWSPRKRKAWSSHSRLVRPEDELTWDRDAELSGEPLPVLENGQREELVYMVLSYVGGGDLFTMIAEKQRYIGDDSLIRSVFTQLLDAVEWCHERNVRHRDLKPENVLCEEGGRTVLISDFGLATTDPKSRDYGCGSSYYMSPECYGDPLSPATSASYDTCANDVWTLGVVLVNLATGRNPWEAASPLDPTFTSFCADPANFLMSILPITPSANSVLVRVFEQDQAKRCKISELREMVLRVKRWTLRGSELDGADEGARDVARGCGLLDAEMPGIAEENTVVGRVGSGGSGMVERSRFSEDTMLDYGEEDGEGEEDVEWSMCAPGMGRGRSESTISTSSEMSRSRPVSKILSNSPTLQGPVWGEPEPEVGDQSLLQSESIPRWPKIIQGWGLVEPSTPPMATGFDSTTPKAIAATTPKATGIPKPTTPGTTTTPRTQAGLKAPKTPVLYTPRSTPSLRTPRSNPTLQPPRAGTVLAEVSRSGSGSPGLLNSPYASKIPRYTGSPRTRTVSFDPPSTRTINFEPEARMRTNSFEPSSRTRTISFDPLGAGRSRMRSAPGPEATKKPGVKTKVSFGDLSAMAIGRLKKSSMRDLQSKDSSSSMREFYSKGSLSTLSVASSESSGFPFTPLKAEVILSSPRVIVSHPSDPKVWNTSRSSTSSLWASSSERTGETLVDPVHHPSALQRGAPLYDASAGLVDSGSFHRAKAWGMSSPSLSHTQFEETRPLAAPVFARRRNTAASPRTDSPPKQRKVKRVPVPPIPNELLEEHERQMTLKRNGTGRMYELTVDASDEKVAPPPGLAFEDRNGDYRTGPGPKRLLENARAWFRRI